MVGNSVLLIVIYSLSLSSSLGATVFQELLFDYEGIGSQSQVLTSGGVSRLHEDLLRFISCRNLTYNCTKCFLTNKVQELNETSFQTLSIHFVAFNLEHFHCNNTNVSVEKLKNGIFGNKTHLSEQDVKQIVLTLFNKSDHNLKTGVKGHHHCKDTDSNSRSAGNSYKAPGIPHDNHSDTFEEIHQCFNVDVLFEKAKIQNHETGVSLQAFPLVASYLVFYLITNVEYMESCTPLPTKADLLLNIFNRFSSPENLIMEEGFQKLLTSLRIGSHESTAAISTDHGDHSAHNNERKKRAPAHSPTPVQSLPKCLSADEIMTIYGVDHQVGINPGQLYTMSPALIEQMVSQACTTPTKQKPQKAMPTTTQTYGYATGALVIITACSVLGILVIPCLSNKKSQYFLEVLIAMGAATLVGDALLHLLPSVLADHKHAADSIHPSLNAIHVEMFIWYMITALAGIFSFYYLELAMICFKMSKSSQGSSDANGKSNEAYVGNGTSMTSINSIEKPPETREAETGGPVQEINKVLVVMIVVGDAIHNFADGLAMGAAFSFSTIEGLAITIAVFCHELPHEFGDFAVLLSAGLNKWKALGFNLLSAMTGFAGLYIGLAIGQDENTRLFITSIAAGMFMYISLADLFPELLSHLKASGQPKLYLTLQTVGFSIGILSMLLLAIFEEYIHL